MQRKGTGFIGNIFGPVMLAWFVVLALLGIHGIVQAPGVLVAVSPLYAFDFLIHRDFHISFAVLGAAFLAVTGGEAMYADMGHFGRVPIRLAWFAVSLLMAITTLLAALVALQWGYHPIVVIPVNGFFFIIDCIFFAANSTKLLEGGWFPLVLAGVVAFVMLTWRSGVKLVERARGKLRQPEEDLIETATSGCRARLPGTAVFLASAANGVSLALTQFI